MRQHCENRGKRLRRRIWFENTEPIASRRHFARAADIRCNDRQPGCERFELRKAESLLRTRGDERIGCGEQRIEIIHGSSPVHCFARVPPVYFFEKLRDTFLSRRIRRSRFSGDEQTDATRRNQFLKARDDFRQPMQSLLRPRIGNA